MESSVPANLNLSPDMDGDVDEDENALERQNQSKKMHSDEMYRDPRFNSDVQQYMNIHHFEQLMITFHEHKNEDGSTGFDIDKFREVFGKVMGGNLSYDQMTMLFMKIDANSDGTVDWDEFSTYMMTGTMETDIMRTIFDERVRKLLGSPHKDMIKRIDFVAKERKYISVSRDGTVCLWTPNLKLQRSINTRDLNPKVSWVADAMFMQDYNKLVIISDDRQLSMYDVLSIKPRLVAVVSQLENNPLCVAYAGTCMTEN
ncbi:WD40 repeat domain 95 [Quaeritorhiza haematococci]|nr:WD40 repeat domain 95 [Quaeritorhiza haematococci]